MTIARVRKPKPHHHAAPADGVAALEARDQVVEARAASATSARAPGSGRARPSRRPRRARRSRRTASVAWMGRNRLLQDRVGAARRGGQVGDQHAARTRPGRRPGRARRPASSRRSAGTRARSPRPGTTRRRAAPRPGSGRPPSSAARAAVCSAKPSERRDEAQPGERAPPQQRVQERVDRPRRVEDEGYQEVGARAHEPEVNLPRGLGGPRYRSCQRPPRHSISRTRALPPLTRTAACTESPAR